MPADMNLPETDEPAPELFAPVSNPDAEVLNGAVAFMVDQYNFHELDATAIVLAYVTKEVRTILEWETPTLSEVVKDALAIIEADIRDWRRTCKGLDVFQGCLEMHDRPKVPQFQDLRIALPLNRAELTTVTRLRVGTDPKFEKLNFQNRHTLVDNGDIIAMCAWLAIQHSDFFSEATRLKIVLAQRRPSPKAGGLGSPKPKTPLKFHFTREQKQKMLELMTLMGPKPSKVALIEKAISETIRYYTATGEAYVKHWTKFPSGLTEGVDDGVEKLPQETIQVRAALLPQLDLLVARFSGEYREFSRQDLILQLGLPLVELCLRDQPRPAAAIATGRLEPIRFSPFLTVPLIARKPPILIFGKPPEAEAADNGRGRIGLLEEIPPETPVLMDAWLVALAITGGANRVAFSKQAKAFLDLRIQHRVELLFSAMEVPKLFEWLNRLEAFPATETTRAEWLRKLLDVLGASFRILTPTKEDGAEAAALQLNLGDSPNGVGLPHRQGTDGLLQAVCARRLNPDGFAIATATNEYDHLAGVFGVHKPEDAAMWDAGRHK